MSTPERRTVVQETRVVGPVPETVITTLPPDYRILTYRGVTHYEYDSVYYRKYPRTDVRMKSFKKTGYELEPFSHNSL